MKVNEKDFELMRQIHQVLVLHFIEGQKQSDIATYLNLSTSKVNRLITQGRKLGMVKIDIESPFQALQDLEKKLLSNTGLDDTIITPSVSGNIETTLQQVGCAAANHLVETLRDGDVIAVTGGRAVYAVVEGLSSERSFDVTVVPLTGGVQGKFHTDVNYLTTRMAEQLGGKAVLMHAPLFAESQEQRDMLREVASIRDVFDLAHQADIAIVGIGSIEPEGSSYYDLNPIPEDDRKALSSMGVVCELLAHLIDFDGSVSDYALNSRLVALAPANLANFKRVIGVTAGQHKVLPIQAALNGGYLNSLILDEETASSLLSKNGGCKSAA